MKAKTKTTDEDVMAIFAKIAKQSGLSMAMLQLDHDDGFEPECLEMTMEPMDIDFDAFPSTPVGSAAEPKIPVTGTRKVTIRIPNRILASCRAKAALSGSRYQSLIIRTLNTASKESWGGT